MLRMTAYEVWYHDPVEPKPIGHVLGGVYARSLTDAIEQAFHRWPHWTHGMRLYLTNGVLIYDAASSVRLGS